MQTKTIQFLLALILLGIAAHLHGQSNENIIFPNGTALWNVKDYGAVGDGVADDTQAFRDAISDAISTNARYGALRIVYVPNGTYKITERIDVKNLQNPNDYQLGWRSGMFLQGQSNEGTILKLEDNANGFDNPNSPRAVIRTGSESINANYVKENGGGNEAFRHYIKNLTVDVGVGNPGAIGIDYVVNNRGGIYDVTVKSSDPNKAGHIGINMTREWPGPGIIKDVTIDGFSRGFDMWWHFQYGMVFENITLKDQSEYGFRIMRNSVTIRNLKSDISVPVFYCEQEGGHITIMDSELIGGSSSESAIDCKGTLYVRNTSFSGYGKSIEDRGSNNKDRTSDYIDEYWNYGVFKKYDDAIDGAMRLPVKETPEYHNNDFSQWAVVDRSADDDLPALQAAIDSGKPVVFLPQGSYNVSNTIVIRGNVRKFLGGNAYVNKRDNFPDGEPLIRFDGGGGDVTIVQNMRIVGDIEHNSSKGFALVNAEIGFTNGSCYNTAQGTGDLFIEDGIFSRVHVNYPQDVWLRQLNSEFAKETFVYNNGGRMWIFGYKTEGARQTVLHNDGGEVELWGGFLYANNATPNQNTVPMIINEDGEMTANYKVNGPPEIVYQNQIQDIRGNTTRTLTRGEVPGGNNMPIYSSATAVIGATCLESVTTGATLAGLEYEYYEGTWEMLPNFDLLTPIATGTIATVNLSPASRDNDFALRYTGYIEIAEEGDYTFYTTSDDGSKLYVGGQEIVDNDGRHGSKTESGTICLEVGKHELVVTYFEAIGSEVLDVEYEGPNVSRQSLPASVLSHADATLQSICLTPTNDAYLQDGSLRNDTMLRIEQDRRISYAMFDLGAIDGTITEATLEVVVTRDDGNGTLEIIKGLSNNWTETTLNTGNAPAEGANLATLNQDYNIGDMLSIDLDETGLTLGDLNSFILKQTSGNDFVFSSKEGSFAPELCLTYTTAPTTIAVDVRIFLEGTYDGTDMTHLFDDIMPTTEPYTALGYTYYNNGGGETTTASIINSENIVDWVVIELRDKADNTQVVASRAALLTSDGRIVSHADGTSPVTFQVDPDDYFVAVHHRNHLKVMTEVISVD